jgi:hypothetical protein
VGRSFAHLPIVFIAEMMLVELDGIQTGPEMGRCALHATSTRAGQARSSSTVFPLKAATAVRQVGSLIAQLFD